MADAERLADEVKQEQVREINYQISISRKQIKMW